MGRFKDVDSLNEIKEWLCAHDYKYDRGAQGEPGYVCVYTKDENSIWVTIDLLTKKIYIFSETTYDSSFNFNKTIHIEYVDFNDLDDFINKVDEELDSYI